MSINATAGYKAVLEITGQPMAMTEEPLTNTGDNQTFVVTNLLRDVWAFTSPLTVQTSPDGSTWTTITTGFTVQYLVGTVRLNTPQAGIQVRVTGEFLPRYTFALARSVDFEDSVAELDVTTFGDDYVRRIYGLADVSGSIQSLSVMNDEIGEDEKTLRELIGDREFVVLSYRPDEDNSFVQRAVIMFSTRSLSMSVDDVQTASIDFVGANPRVLGGPQIGTEYRN